MTAYEFRGFIVNLILGGLAFSAIYLLAGHAGLPVWGWVLIGIGLAFIFPLPPADFKRRPVEDRKVPVPDNEKGMVKSS